MTASIPAMSPATALQSAIVDLLKADAGVVALIADRVFDELPADIDPAQPPWLALGPIGVSRFEGCGAAWLIRVRLFAACADFGRLEAWAIADAAIRALDDRGDGETPAAVPVLPAPFAILDSLRVVQAGDVIDPLQLKTVFIDLQATVARI